MTPSTAPKTVGSADPKATTSPAAHVTGHEAGDTRQDVQPADTGESATTEAYEAIAGQFRRLKWTKKGVVGWLTRHFGLQLHTALTHDQADAAYLMLLAHGNEAMYDALVKEFVTAGRVSA